MNYNIDEMPTETLIQIKLTWVHNSKIGFVRKKSIISPGFNTT